MTAPIALIQKLSAQIDQDRQLLAQALADETKAGQALADADQLAKDRRQDLAAAETAHRQTQDVLAAVADQRAALAAEVEMGEFLLAQAEKHAAELPVERQANGTYLDDPRVTVVTPAYDPELIDPTRPDPLLIEGANKVADLSGAVSDGDA